MVGILILLLALITLYVLARIFIQKLFIVLYRLAHEREDAATLLGWVFLPGTFIHEMAHLLMALVLIVPFGELNLFPEVTDQGIKLGSVQVGKTDFVRSSLIGLAPIIAGGAILFFSITFALTHLTIWWVIVLTVYLVFEITHTMFSSSKDLTAVLELVVFLAVISGALIFFKIYTPFTFIFQKMMQAGPFSLKLGYFLFIPIALELAFLAFFRKVRI